MKNLTIKSRLFIAIVAILVCSYSLLFFSSYISIQQFTEDEIAKDLQTAVKFARSQFSARPEMVQEALKLPVSSAPVQSWFMQTDTEKLRDAVMRWNKSLDFLEMLTLIDAGQNVIVRNNGKNDAKCFVQGHLLKSLFRRKQPIITTELVSHEEYCREVHADACMALPDNRDVMVQLVLIPVVGKDGSLLGAVVAGDDVNKDPHLPYQQQQVFGKTLEMMITQMGERIASTMPAGSSLSPTLEMKVIQALKGGYSFNGFTVLNNRNYEMIAEPIQNHNGEFIGSIAVALEKSSFSNIKHENYQNLLLCALLSVPLILVLAYVTARQFAQPIRQLSETVGQIESGDLGCRVPADGAGEFQEIYDSFNRMAETFARRAASAVRESALLVDRNVELEQKIRDWSSALEKEAGKCRAVLDSLEEGILVTDADRNIIQINAEAEKLLGAGARGAQGKPLAQLCIELRLIELAEQVGIAVKQQSAERKTVVTFPHAGRKLQVSIVRLLGERGGQMGFMLEIHDVSGDAEVDRLKSEFIATVSHELKTPLTSMKGSLQFILKKGKWLTGVEREMLVVCMRNTERLISLIGSILEISRIESGQVPFTMKPVVVGELALYALEELKGAAMTRNISFVNGIGFDLPHMFGDYERLHQVMTNLLSNAVKFSPTDSVVTLMAERVGNFIAISVSDDGKVIKPSDRDRLFTKFQQFSQPEDGEPGGSGLGLAICREIVVRHGGTIHYAPGMAGGNTFTFTVPVYGENDGQG